VADVIAARLKLDGQAQFSSGAKRASADVGGIGKSAEKSNATVEKSSKTSASSLLSAAAAAGVTYKAVQGLKSSVNTTVDLAKSTASLSRVTGLDSKQAQAWSVVAKNRNIEGKQLQMGMATLGRNLGALGGPTGASDQALKQFGLTSKQLMAMPMDKRMAALADGFKGMPDGVQKAALAQKLFGRSGQALLPLLNSGSKGLQGQLDSANKLVPPLGNAGKASLDLAKQQRTMQTAMMGLKVSVGSALLPVITQLTTAVMPLVTGFTTLLAKCPALTYAILALAAATAGLMIFSKVKTLMDALKVSTIAKTVADKAAAVATKAWTVAQWLFNAAMTANPIMLVVVAIGALIGILVLAYLKVGWFKDAVQAMGGAVVASFNWVKQAAINVFGWIKGNWPLLLGILAGPFGLAVALIITHFDKIKKAASDVFNSVKTIFGKIPGVIKSMFSGAGNFAGNVGREIADWLNANTPFGDHIKVGPVDFTLPALATGGTMLQGGMALVGEKGPELVTLPAGATVTPIPATASMAATINVPVYLDTRQIALVTAQYNSDQAARQGKVA
jgi:TP901 family phage tail tape measure protein